MNSKRSFSAPPDAARRLADSARATAHVLCAALFVVSFACAAEAQSGRHVRRQPEIAPVPTPTPEPQPKTPVREAVKKIGLLVLADNSISVQTSTSAQSIVMQTFGQRLRESGAFEINAESARSSRGEAVKRAKNEKERFVVWIELRYNGFNNDPYSINRPRAEDYHIEYGVFEPVTGRTKSSGNVYPRPSRGSIGGVPIGAPSCYPATLAYESEFLYAAIDAANRVMRSFSVTPPPVCGG